MDRPLAAYNQLVDSGAISADPAQRALAERLGALSDALTSRKKPLFGKLEPVRGLYVWGGVGRGKSMLMDLFFRTTPVKLKRRVHFHAFMRETHAFLAYWRGLTEAERKRSQWRVRGAGDDPIQPAAAKIAAHAELLCFDEFQVTQIADAMILSRLFGALFDLGVTVVATSNRPPDDLYRNGLNRALFLPFIDRLKAACEIVELSAERDYRLERLSEARLWLSPLGPEADAAMSKLWAELTLGETPSSVTLDVDGRALDIPCQSAGCARFGFDELCARPLGPGDYLAIASEFHTVLVSGIPVLTPEHRNEAARFVSLVDALYESRTKLVASAAAEPNALYPEGDGAFEFERTASRLHEMRSAGYIAAERRAPADG